MVFYLIRHAEQDGDGNLTPNGYKEADILAEYLKDKHIAKVFSSDRVRAEETARIVSEHLKIPHETLKDLSEIWETTPSETESDASERVKEALLRILPEYPNEILVFVLHNNLIRSFAAGIGYPKYLENQYSMDHTEIIKMDYSDDQFKILEYGIDPSSS